MWNSSFRSKGIVALAKSDLSSIEAVGFDLFETLVFVRSGGLRKAMISLVSALRAAGFRIEPDVFAPEYIRAAREALDATKRDGRETHNRFWIATALQRCGVEVSANDQRIADAIENYFDEFVAFVELIPETESMLANLSDHFSLGLLTNFTHPPAARKIIGRLKLDSHFDEILISGDLGFRKPHGSTFSILCERMGTKNLVFVGDNVEADVEGAQDAGIQPVWANHSFLADGVAGSSIAGKPERKPGTQVPVVRNWHQLETLLLKR